MGKGVWQLTAQLLASTSADLANPWGPAKPDSGLPCPSLSMPPLNASSSAQLLFPVCVSPRPSLVGVGDPGSVFQNLDQCLTHWLLDDAPLPLLHWGTKMEAPLGVSPGRAEQGSELGMSTTGQGPTKTGTCP